MGSEEAVTREMRAWMAQIADVPKGLDTLIKIDKSFYKAWNNRGLALKNLKRKDEALESFTQALNLNSQYIDAILNKGRLLLDTKRYPEAFEILDNALTIEPKNEMTWYYKGMALERMKQYKRAIKCYDQALALNPQERLGLEVLQEKINHLWANIKKTKRLFIPIQYAKTGDTGGADSLERTTTDTLQLDDLSG